MVGEYLLLCAALFAVVMLCHTVKRLCKNYLDKHKTGKR